MEFTIPEGWAQDSHTLYLHSSGVRIERRIYHHKEGWVLVPVDLDQKVVEFVPNSDGLEQAFAAFAKGALNPKGAVPEARKAARRDEKLEEASDDEEKKKEEEDEDEDES